MIVVHCFHPSLPPGGGIQEQQRVHQKVENENESLSVGAALLQQNAKLLSQNSENILNLRVVETTWGFVEFTTVFSSYTQSQDKTSTKCTFKK